MRVNYYLPIYKWGDIPNTVSGVTSGCSIYSELKDLYGFEPEAIGHYELVGFIPTKEEFEKEIQENS